jgi:hypothetical protein
VYSPNQAGLLVLALFALYKVASRPSILRRDTWRPAVALAVLLFLSSSPIRSFVQNGRVYPNFRTGYDGERPTFEAERVRTMTAMAGRQLFVSADDPWFSKPGGGLAFPEAALFLPGALLALGGLFLKRRRDLAVVILLGLPISVIPGVLAPDPSFRRFFLTATVIRDGGGSWTRRRARRAGRACRRGSWAAPPPWPGSSARRSTCTRTSASLTSTPRKAAGFLS